MRFLVLGPLKVIDGDREVALAGRRRTVLAVLLSNAGQVVPLDYLVDAVWDDGPPATARRQIQNDISALRRGLSGGIVSDGYGYRIVPRPGELDAQVFADQVAEALELAGRGEHAAAAAELRSALGLWRGPALLGLSGRAVEAAAVRLDEQRLAAAEDCFDLELSLGRQRELVGELVELVAAYPLRERLVGQLMLALHGSGRQSEALAAYDRLRTRLADEMGLAPGSPLQQLQVAILRNDPAVDPPAAAPAVAGDSGAAAAPPAQLPAQVSGFTGRDDHLRGLDELLPGRTGRAANAVVITAIAGTAGIGKTALAVHWGHRVRSHFPDGQLYIDLRGFSVDAPVRAVEALAHLLRSLGEPAERIPADVQTAAGRYRSLLADRRVLVVLDNAVSADQVRPLLPGSPGCLVLVTSRDRLTGLLARDGAGSLTLDVLTPVEAYTLLEAVLGPDRVAAEPAATAELARICSHLPLALRVAAANLTSHPWTSIAAYVAALRAGDRLTALDVDGDEQSGVRRAFDLSYRTLPPDAQRVFRLLGLVPGPHVTVEAVAAMAATSAAHARRQLDRLVTVHLVNQPVLGRYTGHDLLRHYAADRARADDTGADREVALRRLHDWYLHSADRAARLLYGQIMRLPAPAVDVPTPVAMADEAAALAWLDAERANLVAAIRHAAEHGPRSGAWLLADALRGYFWLGMHIADWQHAAQAALAAAQADGNLRAQAAVQLSLADSHYRQGRLEPAIERYEAALPLAEQAGWAQCEIAAIGNLGVIYRDSGRVRHAVDYLDRGLKLCRTNGWQHGEAITLHSLGRAYLQLGQLLEASQCCATALTINRAIGSRMGEASVLADLGEILHAQGRLDEAVEHLTEAQTLYQELGDRTNQAIILRVLAAVRCDRGATAEAAELGQAALALTRELGERKVEAEVLNTLGALAHHDGRHRDAIAHHERALALTRATGDRYPETEALIGLAAEHLCLGHRDQADAHARRALVIAREAEYRLLGQRAQAVIDRLTLATSS
ncbi:AfsR/SARP family transcriptional regulator [Phytohabitans sp. LJ34]|uniref:AfsR/SARP family transcriptional regulator n=1 Tax=Phytohabitans sp. LJ34 TaxID=3452217 RepID=UPI003F8B1FF7